VSHSKQNKSEARCQEMFGHRENGNHVIPHTNDEIGTQGDAKILN